MDAEQREAVEAPSLEEPTVIFDPARLTAQLSELLELYLARAKEALLEEQMSSKEAVACAKQVSGMLEDTQSGKLAKVDTSTHWPKLEFTAPAFVGRGPVPRRPDVVGRGPVPRRPDVVGRGPVPRRLASCSEHPGGPQVAALQDPPIQSLESAVSAVCQYDPETAILEPWERVLIRLNQLTRHLSADIETWKASCEEPSPNGVGRADQPGSSAEDTEEFSAGDGGTGVSGTGVPPVIPPKPASSPPDGGARVPALQQQSSSVEQPTLARHSLGGGGTKHQQPASGFG